MYEIAKTIENYYSFFFRNYFLKAYLKDDPQKRKPDIGLAKDKINWQPKVDLGQGPCWRL